MSRARLARFVPLVIALAVGGAGCSTLSEPASAERSNLLPLPSAAVTAPTVEATEAASAPPATVADRTVAPEAATEAEGVVTAAAAPQAGSADGLRPVAEALAKAADAGARSARAPAGALNAVLLTLTNDLAGVYRIAPGDELEVEVLREPDISRVFTVGGDGLIKHPLLGGVRAAGLSAAQFERELTERLGRDYLVNPKVYVRLQRSATRRVMVFGEVRNPGIYDIAHDEEFSLLRVLARAGGFTDIADMDKVRIVRAGDEGDRSMRVRVSDILSGRSEARDIPLESGDVINVPETLF